MQSTIHQFQARLQQPALIDFWQRLGQDPLITQERSADATRALVELCNSMFHHAGAWSEPERLRLYATVYDQGLAPDPDAAQALLDTIQRHANQARANVPSPTTIHALPEQRRHAALHGAMRQDEQGRWRHPNGRFIRERPLHHRALWDLFDTVQDKQTRDAAVMRHCLPLLEQGVQDLKPFWLGLPAHQQVAQFASARSLPLKTIKEALLLHYAEQFNELTLPSQQHPMDREQRESWVQEVNANGARTAAITVTLLLQMETKYFEAMTRVIDDFARLQQPYPAMLKKSCQREMRAVDAQIDPIAGELLSDPAARREYDRAASALQTQMQRSFDRFVENASGRVAGRGL